MKRFLLMMLGLLLLSWQAAASAAPLKRARVELPAATQVTPGQLTLGRVAQITSNDLSLLKQLMGMSVGPAPGLGGAVTLQRKQLAEGLRGEEGVLVEWSGAPATEISVKSRSVKAGEVISAARAALGNWLQLRTVRSHVERISEPVDTLVPSGELELRVRPIGASSASMRRATVWTEIWSDGQFYRVLPTTFEVHAEGSLTYSGTLPASQTQPPVADTADAQEKEVGAALVAQASTAQDKLQVRRGQSASLNSSAGPISVQATVQVLQDGATGQSVQVKSGSKNEVFYARVIGPGQLEVVR